MALWIVSGTGGSQVPLSQQCEGQTDSLRGFLPCCVRGAPCPAHRFLAMGHPGETLILPLTQPDPVQLSLCLSVCPQPPISPLWVGIKKGEVTC